ncbi:MAG TPA: hypothetical protein VH420_07505 [Gaiellaceae bacterium]|jgi:hypothetical protein
MSMQPDETFEGRSEAGFSFATRDAVEAYEKKHGPPSAKGETLRLRVVDLYVEFENPVRDYIVVLGPPPGA